jgi:hypothetical protein
VDRSICLQLRSAFLSDLVPAFDLDFGKLKRRSQSLSSAEKGEGVTKKIDTSTDRNIDALMA